MTIRKALTFRASSIGDALMGKYLLENIHAAYPQARLGLIVASRGAMIRDLLSGYPWLEVIEVNRRDVPGLITLWRGFRGSDATVTQYAGKPGGTFAWASKLAARALTKPGGLVGFTDAAPRLNRYIYDGLVPLIRPDHSPAESERKALMLLRVPVSFPYPTLTVSGGEEVLERFSLLGKKYVVVHLFAGNHARGLSPMRRRELLRLLSEQMPEVELLLTGGKADVEAAKEASEGLRARVIAGEGTLQDAMELIAQSRGVVSVDTGLAHITAQLRRPLIVLTTCLGPGWWAPAQYGDAPIARFSRPELCTPTHVFTNFPPCINDVDISAIAAHAVATFDK